MPKSMLTSMPRRAFLTGATAAVLALVAGCSSGPPPLQPTAPVGDRVKVCATIAHWPIRVADDACTAAGAQLGGCPVDSPEGLIRWWSLGAYGYDSTPIGSPIDYQYLDPDYSPVGCPTSPPSTGAAS